MQVYQLLVHSKIWNWLADRSSSDQPRPWKIHKLPDFMHTTVQYCAARFARKSCKRFSIGPLPRDWIQSPTSRLDSPQSWVNCRRTCLVSVENKTTTFLKMQDASKFGSWAVSSIVVTRGSSQILQVEVWHSYTAVWSLTMRCISGVTVHELYSCCGNVSKQRNWLPGERHP